MKKTILLAMLAISILSCTSKGNQQNDEPKQIDSTTIVGSESWKISQINRFKKDSAIILNYDYKGIAEKDASAMKASIRQLEEAIYGGLEDLSQVDFYKNDTRVSIPLNFFKTEAKKVLDKAKPLYRKHLVKIMADRFWEENIDVKATGKDCTVLWFIGGHFASNKNIKNFQELILKEIKPFGFKRVCYKWIEHDDEYTYYDL